MAGALHAFFVFLPLFLTPSYGDIISLNTILFNGGYDFIDLSHPFDNNTVYWPGQRHFEFTKKTEQFLGKDYSWYAANEFAAAEHGGTHLDAPHHFSMTGKYVGDIPLEKLIVPPTDFGVNDYSTCEVIIADISSKVNGDSNFVLHKQDLDYLINDNMGKPCVIIFKFGWSQYYNSEKYLGIDKQTKTLNFPGLSAELVEWIANSYKNIVGIGVDTASLDPGSSVNYPVHKITSRSGLYNLENVNLDQPVPDHGCTALVMPMKIAEGTGAPLRLVAICPKKIPETF